MTTLSLYDAYPETESIPRVDIAQVPTPVEHLPELGEEIGVPSLHVKRDDKTGELYGGNKVRKLEFLIGDALENDREEIWTVGSLGSHHVLATSIYAREFDLKPVALQFPQPMTDHVLDNLRALSTTKPDLTLASNKASIPMEMLKVKVKEWLEVGPNVKYVPGGGSSKLGALGYVNAALELKEQIDNGDVRTPDYIFVAAGTCGTLAGLVLGCKLAGLHTKVVGIRVVDRLLCNATITSRLANKVGDVLRDHGVEEVPKVDRNDVIILSDYFGGEYGKPTVEGERAISLAERTAGLHLDPTYTAKALSGLIGDKDMLGLSNRTVLYWHTLNSVDLTERIESADVKRDLPETYHKFFEDGDDED
jgi:D-cysteine desulfhydrase